MFVLNRRARETKFEVFVLNFATRTFWGQIRETALNGVLVWTGHLAPMTSRPIVDSVGRLWDVYGISIGCLRDVHGISAAVIPDGPDDVKALRHGW